MLQYAPDPPFAWEHVRGLGSGNETRSMALLIIEAMQLTNQITELLVCILNMNECTCTCINIQYIVH